MARFFARSRAPTAMVTDSTVGIATGIAATKKHQGELQRREDRVTAEDCDEARSAPPGPTARSMR